MAAIDQLLQLFARSIFAKARALYRLELTHRQRTRLRKSIAEDIRTCGGLKARLRIAWILKRENEQLDRLGYRSERVDPEGAYREARIELLKFERGGE
jgi:hypothetical protein